MKGLDAPVVSLVRLEQPIAMPQAPDQPHVRFVFIAFTPADSVEFDHMEIGRTMAALLSNEVWNNTKSIKMKSI